MIIRNIVRHELPPQVFPPIEKKDDDSKKESGYNPLEKPKYDNSIV